MPIAVNMGMHWAWWYKCNLKQLTYKSRLHRFQAALRQQAASVRHQHALPLEVQEGSDQ